MGISLVNEAETVYMSDGLMEILGNDVRPVDEIDFNAVVSFSLYEEEGRRLIQIVIPKGGMSYKEIASMFGKSLGISGILPDTKCKITSVTCERSIETISMLGIVLNT